MSFQDHFSDRSTRYADCRPHYPDALFAALAVAAPAHDAVWDVGCGNGQASVGLADAFAQVLATDPSAAQIAAATAHRGVTYGVASAEQSGLADASVDAVLVAQARHWFHFDRFYAEARRVGRPGAPIVAIAYELAQIDDEIDALVRRFYKGDIGPYWPPDRAHIETGYRNIPWPFARLAFPTLSMIAEWTLEHWLGYLATWSAVSRYQAATGIDPIPAFSERLAPLWGNSTRTVRWPLIIKAGLLHPRA